MKKTFIVANWKCNKTKSEAIEWLRRFKNNDLRFTNKEIVVCSSFIHLSAMKVFIEEQKLPIKLGTQNISSFDEGAYTGEVSAKQIKEFADLVIIGHSERKKYLHETEDDIIAKLKQLIKNNITPILCVSDMKQMDYYLSNDSTISDEADGIIFVYEPSSAISKDGQFRAESPEIINQNVGQISQKIGKKVTTLYGGSVNLQNARSIFALGNIDGCLVGQASLDPLEFLQIIKNA